MQIFLARWPGDRYVKWRSLSWREYNYYQDLLKYLPPAEVYLQIYKKVLIDGPPVEGLAVRQVTAGIVDWVARSLIEHNPFNGLYEDAKRAYDLKKKELDYLGSVKAIIAGLFHYTFEEIDSWDAETLYERIIAAEFVSGKSLEPPVPEKTKPVYAVTDGLSTSSINKDRPVKLKKQLSSAQKAVLERVQNR